DGRLPLVPRQPDHHAHARGRDVDVLQLRRPHVARHVLRHALTAREPGAVGSRAVETISFARGAPSPDLLPLDELADCAETVLAHDGRTILSYGAGAGYAPLRELIGEWFEVHPGRVLLTNGGLQALDLLAKALARGHVMLC